MKDYWQQKLIQFIIINYPTGNKYLIKIGHTFYLFLQKYSEDNHFPTVKVSIETKMVHRI
jgi:hypothetical protein